MRSHFGTAMRSHFWTANRIAGLENGPTPVPQTATGKGGAVEGGGGKFCITKEAPWIASLPLEVGHERGVASVSRPIVFPAGHPHPRRTMCDHAAWRRLVDAAASLATKYFTLGDCSLTSRSCSSAAV